MRLLIAIVLSSVTASLYSQKVDYPIIENDSSLIYIYRHKDINAFNRIAKLFIDDKLKIGLEKGWYDTIHIKNGCFNFKTNKNKFIYHKCLENKKYYFRIDYEYILLIGKFKLIEVTESFADQDMNNLKMRSYKK
jgi:hypothetical protein